MDPTGPTLGKVDVSNEKSPGWLGYIGDEFLHTYMGVSKNNGTPKSSILIGFSMK